MYVIQGQLEHRNRPYMGEDQRNVPVSGKRRELGGTYHSCSVETQADRIGQGSTLYSHQLDLEETGRRRQRRKKDDQPHQT